MRNTSDIRVECSVCTKNTINAETTPERTYIYICMLYRQR